MDKQSLINLVLFLGGRTPVGGQKKESPQTSLSKTILFLPSPYNLGSTSSAP